MPCFKAPDEYEDSDVLQAEKQTRYSASRKKASNSPSDILVYIARPLAIFVMPLSQESRNMAIRSLAHLWTRSNSSCRLTLVPSRSSGSVSKQVMYLCPLFENPWPA